MKLNKGMVLLIIPFLGACFSKYHELHFSNETTFNYMDEINACQLLIGVDNLDVLPGNIQDNEVLINDLVIQCPEIDSSILGVQTINYLLNDKKYPLTVTIADLEPPQLIFSERNIEVDQYDTSFNILDVVEAIDNVDDDIIVGLDSSFDINTAGKYKVRLQAYDKSGNVVYDEIRINVLPGEKPQPEKEIEIVYIERSAGKKEETVKADSSNEKNNESTTKTPVIKPNDQFFSFDDYVTGNAYDDAYNACMYAGNQKLNTGYTGTFNCNVVYDPKLGYTGYQLEFK